MRFEESFKIWNQLSEDEKRQIESSIVQRRVKEHSMIHQGSLDCTGLLVIQSGQLRAYSLSEEGREITLYRLFEQDVCLFSASCIMPSLQFEMMIEAEKETEFWIIPPDVVERIMKQSAVFSNYINETLSARFSEVMWLMEQVMWKSLDKRLANFLLEESVLEQTAQLKITHEKIANHLGSQREVISRMLKYFQQEELVQLSRGTVELLDMDRLEMLCE
ncbi:MAG: Crp/Fnr family transcriptional regulator [Erysipelotrichaceae bacterium]|nr:Crp/Fnr family transcriptional regulator [Erysipelotrichaceae bacterium]